MKKIAIAMLMIGSISLTNYADDTTYLRHDTLQIGDVMNYTNRSIGLGTTAPVSLLNFQVTNTDKTIPLLKISQNVGTPSYGIIFDGSELVSDPRSTKLKIVDMPSRNVLMSITRSSVIFGNMPPSDPIDATVIVAKDNVTSPNRFSGTMLLVANDTSSSAPNFGTVAVPNFGTFRGRNSSRRGAILKLVNDSGTHELRFGYQAVTNNHYLTVTVLAAGTSTERTVFFKITRGAKTFVIDHPLKKNNYLVHAGIESPHADVVYMGTGQLKNGKATIQLPAYFEKLTQLKGRTIRITPIDGFDPIALVTNANGEVIQKGKFSLTSSKTDSTQQFEWEVKATRRDVKQFDVEPLKESVHVEYAGPYSWPRAKAKK